MSPPPRIHEFLTRIDEPVYGTTIGPDDFAWFASSGRFGWVVQDRAIGGRDVDVVIWSTVPPDPAAADSTEMSCGMRDSAATTNPLEPFVDPFRSAAGHTAPVQDWYDAICMAEADHATSLRAARRWGGAELPRVMARVEHGITAYQQHEVAVSSFPTLRDLQEWITGALSATTVRVEVLTLLDFPYVAGAMRPGMLLQSTVDDDVVGYVPVVVATNQDSSQWLTPTGERPVPRPRVELRMSGATRTGLVAEFVQSWSDVRDNARLGQTGAAAPARGGWALLHIRGTDLALPLPWGSSNLLIETDNDGARVTLSVHPSAERERHHRLRARFERRWGAWLDDDAVLSAEELHEGIAVAEAALRARIAEEAQ